MSMKRKRIVVYLPAGQQNPLNQNTKERQSVMLLSKSKSKPNLQLAVRYAKL